MKTSVMLGLANLNSDGESASRCGEIILKNSGKLFIPEVHETENFLIIPRTHICISLSQIYLDTAYAFFIRLYRCDNFI